MRKTRQPAEQPVENSASHHKDQMAKATTTYEKFTAACDWLFAASRRAGNLDDTIDEIVLMIADRERQVTP